MASKPVKPHGCSNRTDPLVVLKVRRRGLRRAELEAFAGQVRDRVAGRAYFCCLIGSDEFLQRLNREFLGKDYSTDVLSFPTTDPRGAIGDIAISADRAREQAAALGHDLLTELRILILHGVLHLLGHDHETDRGQMRRLETRWRRVFGLPSGLIERTRGCTLS